MKLPKFSETYIHSSEDTTWAGRSLKGEITRIPDGAGGKLAKVLPSQEMARINGLLAWSDLVVISSLYENFPYVATEAMVASRPVMGTLGSGLSEIIEHGRSGLLVQPGEVGAISEMLTACVRGEFKVAKMSLAAARTAERYRADVVVADLCRQHYSET